MGSSKTVERVEKLLRLASPKSGTTDAERASAALTALDLIDQHGIKITLDSGGYCDAAGEERSYAVRDVWVRSQARYHYSCSYCGKLVSPGDMVLVRAIKDKYEFEYRHHYRPCGLG